MSPQVTPPACVPKLTVISVQVDYVAGQIDNDTDVCHSSIMQCHRAPL